MLVLNGTSRTGHAGATTGILERLGYTSATPDNHPRNAETYVLYQEGICAEAERATDDLGLPDAEIRPVEREDLPVVVGRARLVVVTGADSL